MHGTVLLIVYVVSNINDSLVSCTSISCSIQINYCISNCVQLFPMAYMLACYIISSAIISIVVNHVVSCCSYSNTYIHALSSTHEKNSYTLVTTHCI